MSDVLPKSSPDAAARCIIPPMPDSMSAVFQPAIDMYSSASPASFAVNLVVPPISLAFAVSCSISPCVAPEIALTLDIWASNSPPMSADFLITAAEAPAAAALTAKTVLNAALNPFAIGCAFCPKSESVRSAASICSFENRELSPISRSFLFVSPSSRSVSLSSASALLREISQFFVCFSAVE